MAQNWPDGRQGRSLDLGVPRKSGYRNEFWYQIQAIFRSILAKIVNFENFRPEISILAKNLLRELG